MILDVHARGEVRTETGIGQMRLGKTIALGLAAWTLGIGAAFSDETGSVASGRSYAERVCAECHSLEPAAVRVLPGRPASFRVIANTPGMTATALEVWFRTPHPTMPNLVIPADDRRDLIAFILSYRDR